MGIRISNQRTQWPRPAREIRDELVALAYEAYEAGRALDPIRLDELAAELQWAAATAKAYGGDPAATDQLARACEETAELARLTAARRRLVAV